MKIILDFNQSTSYRWLFIHSSLVECWFLARDKIQRSPEKNLWEKSLERGSELTTNSTLRADCHYRCGKRGEARLIRASEPSCVCARGTKEGNWRIFEHEVYLIKSVLLIYHFRFEFYQKRYESLHRRDALLFDTQSFQCSHIRRHLTPLCCARVMARARPFIDLSLPRNPRISRLVTRRW